MKEHVLRLHKDQDLKIEIDNYVKEKNIKAGAILCCVGCLTKAVIRCANGVDIVELTGEYEIVSITGTVSTEGCHLHIAISDKDLTTLGGHLKEGCLINTTAEIVILELGNYEFTREYDENTGYKELSIIKKGDTIE